MDIEILIRADSLNTNDESQQHNWNSDEIITPTWRKSRAKILLSFALAAVSGLLVQTAFLLNSSGGQIFNFYTHVEHRVMATASGSATKIRDDYVEFFDSLNENKLSLIVLLANFFCKFLDCLILPQYFLRKLGAKATTLISFSSYLIYFVSCLSVPVKQVTYFGRFLFNICQLNSDLLVYLKLV
jgi:hypothetical protein